MNMQPTGFNCSQCGQPILRDTEGVGTGYATSSRDANSPKICYACCGLNDAKEMHETGKIMLYLVGNAAAGYRVTNWPNTLSFKAKVRKGRHNIAGSRYDVWFDDETGDSWYGCCLGENSQLCRCRRLKKPDVKVRKFEFWTFDVWGNAKNGFDVNDRYRQGTVSITCKGESFNVGTPHEFKTYHPTDRQLSSAVGGRGLEWETSDGSDYFATLKRNGKPVCELIEVRS